MANAVPALSFAEFCEAEPAGTSLRHELVGGRLYLMATESERHDLAARLVYVTVAAGAREVGGRAFIGDRLIRVASGDAYYPDVMVVCGPAAHQHYEQDASLIVEVLSGTTEDVDRREKAQAYASNANLLRYIVVDPEHRCIEVASPGHDGLRWTAHGPGDGVDTGYGVIDLDSFYHALEAARSPAPAASEPVSLFNHFQEICRAHLSITDFRAKLLGVLPLAAGASAVVLLRSDEASSAEPVVGQNSENVSSWATKVGLFGLVVTVGLFMYELRQTQKCIAMRKQAAALEELMGVPGGCAQFRDSPAAQMGIVSDEVASWIVYMAVFASFIYVGDAGGDGWWRWLAVVLGAVALAALVVRVVAGMTRKRHHEEVKRKIAKCLGARPQSAHELADSIDDSLIDVVPALGDLARDRPSGLFVTMNETCGGRISRDSENVTSMITAEVV